MIPAPFDEIKPEHIQALCHNKVPEDQTTEYKAGLPTKQASSKNPFLESVTAFANTNGGDLLLGLQEDKGIPTSIPGVECPDADAEKRRLDSMIRSGTDPSLSSFQVQPVKMPSGAYVFAIRVRTSWNLPHAVNETGRFYKRGAARNYPLGAAELRNAFILSLELPRQARNFRLDRVAQIMSGETPVPLADGAKLIVHFIPLTAFTQDPWATSDAILTLGEISALGHSSGGSTVLNVDGLLTHIRNSLSPSTSSAYSQTFRSGIVEGVETCRIWQGKKVFDEAWERDVCSYVQCCLDLAKDADLPPPYLVFLSLAATKGYILPLSSGMFAEPHPFDRDLIQLPEVTIRGPDADPRVELKRCFDMIWNGVGVGQSPNYDDKDRPRF